MAKTRYQITIDSFHMHKVAKLVSMQVSACKEKIKNVLEVISTIQDDYVRTQQTIFPWTLNYWPRQQSQKLNDEKAVIFW